MPTRRKTPTPIAPDEFAIQPPSDCTSDGSIGDTPAPDPLAAILAPAVYAPPDGLAALSRDERMTIPAHVDAMLWRALPSLVATLIHAGLMGDRQALVYLVNRMLGAPFTANPEASRIELAVEAALDKLRDEHGWNV